MASTSRKRTAKAKDGSRHKRLAEDREAVEVLCRLLPYNGSNPCLTLLDENTVKCSAPETFQQRNGQAYADKLYKFGYVFDETETQKTVFERCGVDIIENLITAKNSLLFTYGVTGSGKTFTMTGNNRQCGIIPRALDTLFNSIENKAEKCVFVAEGKNTFRVIGPVEAVRKRREIPSNTSQDIDDRYVESTKVAGYNDDYACAVFVSYIEIYNNVCYDLLGDSEDGGLPRCEVREDSRKATYVDGAMEVEVANADEALLLLAQGDARRRQSETILNKESSRSHSVFMVRLVMAPFAGASAYPVTDPSQVLVSQMCLVDLAGSERQKRTLNTGERLKEASNINNSLSALRNCLQKLREIQKGGGRAGVVSYRANILTFLFKNFLEGQGKIRMIICANPRPDDYHENLSVFEFAEESQNVLIRTGADRMMYFDEHRPPVPRKFFSKWNIELEAALAGIESSSSHFPETYCFDVKNVWDAATIGKLRENLARVTSMHLEIEKNQQAAMSSLDSSLRPVLCTFDYQNGELEKWKKEKEEEATAHEKTRAERRQLRRENEALRERLSHHEGVSDEMMRSEAEMRKSKKEDAAKRRMYMETVQQALEIAEGGSPSVAQLRSRFGGSTQDSLNRRNDKTVSSAATMTTSAHSQHHGRPEKENSRGPGFYNPKFHRRSKSAPRIVDHQPTHRVPTGTILTTKYPSNTRHTTRPEAHHLKASSDYLLTHQEVNEEGNIDTSIYKGECIPTAGGGTAVCFNDVEKIIHQTPNKTSTKL